MEHKHYIVMGGIKGCIPSHCDAYTDLESAVDSASQIYDFGRVLRKRLKDEQYIDFESFQVIAENWGSVGGMTKASRIFGNEYVSINECDCAEPWIHSEDGDPEYWEEYPEFQVNEYSTGYEIEDLATGKTHWLSDGTDYHDCLVFDAEDESKIPDVGTEEFRLLWQESFNQDRESTREAYRFDE